MLLLLSYTAYPAGMAALLAVAPYTPFAWSASTVSGLEGAGDCEHHLFPEEYQGWKGGSYEEVGP